MEIEVTEHKSVGKIDPMNSAVRVFVNREFHYGYFVREHDLFGLLTPEQQEKYLQGKSATLDVSPDVAQKIIDMGQTPYAKPRVA